MEEGGREEGGREGGETEQCPLNCSNPTDKLGHALQ